MIPLVYHDQYNFSAWGLERFHPFDCRKYRRIHDELIARGLRKREDFVTPECVADEQLQLIHTTDYLNSLQRSEVVAKLVEIPVLANLPAWITRTKVLGPMRWAVGGTIHACRLALEHGIAINLGGGFHHAMAGRGGGFCLYADAAVAAKSLYDAGRIHRLLIVDLDAHQGNGTASIVRDWPWAAMLDLYAESLFPWPKEQEQYAIPVDDGLAGYEYLNLIAGALPEVLDEMKPDFVIYNAGSDPYEDDPLANFRLTKKDLADRDLLVMTTLREQSVPVAMVLSGGYSRESWLIHTEAIESILTRFDRSCSFDPTDSRK